MYQTITFMELTYRIFYLSALTATLSTTRQQTEVVTDSGQ